MDREFWIQRWQENLIGFHQDKVNQYLESYWPTLELAEASRVFVPLCGKSLDLIWLAEQGHEVIGVEISPLAVESFFKENGLKPNISDHGHFIRFEAKGISILLGDFFKLKAEDLGEITAVFDRASLIALPPDMRQQYAEYLPKITGNSQVLLISMEYDQSLMQGPPFSVSEAEISGLYSKNYRIEQITEIDILKEMPRFRDRGLNRLNEYVYRLVIRE